MIKIKIAEYEIVDLTGEDYSFLKQLFVSNGYRGLPPLKIACKFLLKEDVLHMYQITEEYYLEQI